MCLAMSAAGTCAAASEPCYFDVRCKAGANDPHGGLGCNAGGHAACRFCGFGVYKAIPCPAGDSGAKQSTIMLSGSIDSIGVDGSEARRQWKTAFKSDLATLMRIDKSRIAILDVHAASIAVEIVVSPSTQATSPTVDSAIDRVQTALAATDPPLLNGMPVIAIDVRAAPPAPPFGPETQLLSSSASLDMTVSALSHVEEVGSDRGSLFAGISMGAGFLTVIAIVLVTCACLLRSCIRRRRRHANASHKQEEELSSAESPLPLGRPMPRAPSAQQKLGDDGFLPTIECDPSAMGAAVALPRPSQPKPFTKGSPVRATAHANSYMRKWESETGIHVTTHRGMDETSTQSHAQSSASVEVVQGSWAPDDDLDEPIYRRRAQPTASQPGSTKPTVTLTSASISAASLAAAAEPDTFKPATP